jgi:HAD superfamily hydrolase (TIGR01450 family)
VTFVDPAVICDLDGVVYRGDVPVPGSAEALQALVNRDIRVVFATNNSSRTPGEVVDKIRRVTGLIFDVTDIVTSAQAAARLIPKATQKCLVVGGPGLREAVAELGRAVVDAGDSPDCVLVGIDREVNYADIATAASAIRGGAIFIASNVDPTFPVANGLMPGAGAIVAAISVASGTAPLVAGKPESPMRDLIKERGIGSAWVIGDRMDTDIEMAVREPGWRSILVLTGVTDKAGDTGAAGDVAADLAAAVGLVLSYENRQ